MSDRLPTGLAVSALVRRVNDAGGLGVVRARGDIGSGGVLVVMVDRAGPGRVLERATGPDGGAILIDSTPGGADATAIEAYWQRRRAHDRDLWVVELDIPSGERFVAETIL